MVETSEITETKMQDFIATYDIDFTTPSPYTPFKEQALALGWVPKIPMADGSLCELPNTTLVGSFEDINQAVAHLEIARQATEREIGVRVNITRLCIVPIGVGVAKDAKPNGLRNIHASGYAGRAF